MSPAAKRRPKNRQANALTGVERMRRLLKARKAVGIDELSSDIARQVTERRQAWDLSQRELAELCGTTQSAIARLERGLRPPRVDTLQRVAAALDCELEVELRPHTAGEDS